MAAKKKQIKNYDWKITAKKVGIEFAKIFIIGFISWSQDKPQYLALLPILKGIENTLKNWN